MAAVPRLPEGVFGCVMSEQQTDQDSVGYVKQVHEYLDHIRINYTDRAVALNYDPENPLLFNGEHDVSGGRTLHAFKTLLREMEALKREVSETIEATEHTWSGLQTETNKEGVEVQIICPDLLVEIIRFAQPILKDIYSREGISTSLLEKLGDDKSCNMVLRALPGIATCEDDDNDDDNTSRHGIERSQYEASLKNEVRRIQKEKEKVEYDAKEQSLLFYSRLQAKDDMIQTREKAIKNSDAVIQRLTQTNSQLGEENEQLRSRVRQLDQICQSHDSLCTDIQHLIDLGTQELENTDMDDEDSQNPSAGQSYKDSRRQLNGLVLALRLEKRAAVENAVKANAVLEEETRARSAKEVELEEAKKRIIRLSTSLDAQQESLRDVSAELVEITKDRDERKRNFASLYCQRAGLRVEFKQAQREISRLREELEAARQDAAGLERDKQQAKEELEAAHRYAAALDKDKQQARAQLEAAFQDTVSLNRDKQQTREQLDSLNEELAAVRQDAVALKHDKQRARQQSIGLKTTIAALEAELESARQDVATLNQDKQHATYHSDGLQATFTELNEKLEATRQDAASRVKALEDLQVTSRQLVKDLDETKKGKRILQERCMEFFLGGKTTIAQELLREIAREDAKTAVVDAGVYKPWLVEGTWTRAQQYSDYSHSTITEVIMRLPSVLLRSEWNGNEYLALMRRLTELLSEVREVNVSVIDLLVSVIKDRLRSLPSKERDPESVALWAMLDTMKSRWHIDIESPKPEVLAAAEEIVGNFKPNQENKNCFAVGDGDDKLYLVKQYEWPQAVVIKHMSRHNDVWFVDRDCGKWEERSFMLRGGPSRAIEIGLEPIGAFFYINGW